MRAAALLGLLLAAPAAAREGEDMCRAAYQPAYASDWDLSQADWLAACARREESKDILKAGQRAFIDGCMRRVPPRNDLPAWKIQIECARGKAAERQMLPVAGASAGPAPADGSATPVWGAGGKQALRRALKASARRDAGACLVSFGGGFLTDRSKNPDPASEHWDFLFRRTQTNAKGFRVRYDRLGREAVVAEELAHGTPSRCIDAPRLWGEHIVPIALRNGIDQYPEMNVWMSFGRMAADEHEHGSHEEAYDKFPRLRGREFWRVDGLYQHVLIDGETGAVLGRY